MPKLYLLIITLFVCLAMVVNTVKLTYKPNIWKKRPKDFVKPDPPLSSNLPKPTDKTGPEDWYAYPP